MMNFLERILRMPRIVLTVMLLLLVAGFGAYTSLPKESFPAIDIPYFYVSTSQTGVSPFDAERLLAKPIEDRVKDLDGLENYKRETLDGACPLMAALCTRVRAIPAVEAYYQRLEGAAGGK